MKKKAKITNNIPIHQWLHTGTRVMIVKSVNIDGTSHNGFKWPLLRRAEVIPAKFDREKTCDGGGLFGWAWGIGVGDGRLPSANDTWIVFSVAPENVIGEIDNGLKCKAVPGEDNKCPDSMNGPW